jgi:hypothetical protein
VQTDLKVVSLPHVKVMNGGAALLEPPAEPPGTSIIRNRSSVMPRTCWVLPSSDASSSRLSVSSRGLPPPNCGGVNAVPVTFSYFHSLDFEIEYSVGLKRTSKGAEPSIWSCAFVYWDGAAIRRPGSRRARSR